MPSLPCLLTSFVRNRCCQMFLIPIVIITESIFTYLYLVTLLKAFVPFLSFRFNRTKCELVCVRLSRVCTLCRQAFDTFLRMISFHKIRTHFVIVSRRTTENAQVKRMEKLNATESCVRSVMRRYKTRLNRVHSVLAINLCES